MTRLTDTILANQAYTRGRDAAMVNLAKGGQFGFQTDYPAYISNTAYVRRNLVARVLEAPRGFDDMQEPAMWYAALKTLIELEPRSIEGFNMGLTVETAQAPFGGAGEQMEDPTNVTRATSTPSMTYLERYGRPIQAFFNAWITELIMDPTSKVPNVVTRGKRPRDLLPDYYGMTVLFFEPDPTFTMVDKAWLCTNMYPKSDGSVEGRRDLTSAGSTNEISIEFTALSQVGFGVNKLAQRLLNEMQLLGNNPNQRPEFVTKVDSFIASPAEGFAERMAAAGRSAVQV